MGQFSLDLNRLCQRARSNTQVVVKKVMLELFAKVIYKTPVDTGLARNSWFTGINSIPTEVGETAKRGGKDSRERMKSELADIKIEGQTIYLVNNLPYIQKLEFGASDQAPQGMVRLSIQEIIGKYGT